MAAAAWLRVLYLVEVLLMTFDLLTFGTGDVWFSLNGTTYQNNSIVMLEDIGGGGDALLCQTSYNACCLSPALGNWFFPNETRVPSIDWMWDFTRTRNRMAVHMNRRRGGVEGIYYCEIPDSINVTQTIYIGVYSSSSAAVLRGTPYQNNSIVTLEDIGEGGDALLCLTNLTACCRPPYSQGLGNWFFPNGTRVLSDGNNSDLHRTRDQMMIRLNRRRGGVEGIYRCEISDAMHVIQTIYIGAYSANTGSPNITNLTYNDQTRTLTCTSTGGPATTVTWRRDGVVITLNATYKQNKRIVDTDMGIYQTVLTIDSSLDLSSIVETYSCTVENDRGESSEIVVVPVLTTEAITTVSSIQPTIDGATTATSIPAITAVTVVIILLIITVGVVILVVLFKKRKQQLELNFQTVMKGRQFELKQEGTTEKETSLGEHPNQSSICTGEYSEIKLEPAEKEACLEEHSNYNKTFVDEYSETKVIPADGKYTPPARPPRLVNMSNPMSGEMESNPMYRSIDKSCDPPSTTSVPQGTTSRSDDIYTMPDITSSQTVETDNEAVYSEAIQPSLFTDVIGSPSDSEDLVPYSPIYTIPDVLSIGEKDLLKVDVINIREIRELGTGLFGKVILAETVGLSLKDLQMSESDEDKSKSTLVAVKKLKSDAPSTTKEAFEKEVTFMSRLNDRNVIRILGVCYEDAPFIMMEYMEKGDLNQYLQKFKTLSTTDSEPQGQITTSTLVHITTQIASAMKYLTSHNFVHRDLATRNCLVGPNYLVKISDFGMSRSLYESHYYRIHGRFALPIRWMSFECFYGKFSQKSDVWAFGVTTWEIFTLAKEQPYNDMSDKQVVDDAIKGKNRKLLARPYMCPIKVYEIMLRCWEHITKQRATFEELFQLLSSYLQ